MSPYNPLATQLYRDRKANVAARVAAGTMSTAEGAANLNAFADDLFRRRGDPRRVDKPPDKPSPEIT